MSTTLPFDMAGRLWDVAEAAGDTFGPDLDFKGTALTIEIKTPEEARAVLSVMLSRGEPDAAPSTDEAIDNSPYSPYRTERPAGAFSWYWGTSDDGALFGPYGSEGEARQAWLDDDGDELRETLEEEGEIEKPITDEVLLSMCPLVGQYRSPRLSTDLFDAEDVLERMEDRNEEALWGDKAPEWPAEAKADLEKRLATALHDWMTEHNLWGEFRALEGC